MQLEDRDEEDESYYEEDMPQRIMAGTSTGMRTRHSRRKL